MSDAALVALVKELRRALEDNDPQTRIVRTAHGVGYACAAPIDREPARPTPVSRWIVTGGRRIALADGENVIGREPAAAILLDVAGVSRRHARISVSGSDVVLDDLGSKNGTFVGGERVSAPVRLRDGDEIRTGAVVMRFRMTTPKGATATWSGGDG